MKAFVMARLKAFVAALAPAITLAILSAVEASFGFTFGDEAKASIVGIIAGAAVHEVPNK